MALSDRQLLKGMWICLIGSVICLYLLIGGVEGCDLGGYESHGGRDDLGSSQQVSVRTSFVSRSSHEIE